MSAERTPSGYRASHAARGHRPGLHRGARARARGDRRVRPEPSDDVAGRGGRARPGWPARPPAGSCSPCGSWATSAPTARASRSPRGCSSWAWPTCARWASGRWPARTWNGCPPAPTSPARSPSWTARTSSTWPGSRCRRSSRWPCRSAPGSRRCQTSLGKVLLAALDPAEVDAVLAEPTPVRADPALAAGPRRAGRRAARGPGPRLGAHRRAAGPGHPVGRRPAARRVGPGDRRGEREHARRGDPGRAPAGAPPAAAAAGGRARSAPTSPAWRRVPHVTRTAPPDRPPPVPTPSRIRLGGRTGSVRGSLTDCVRPTDGWGEWTSRRGPLAGVLVADFSRVLAGPYATMLLADLGADVIKVEGPDGDETRTWMPPVRDGVSTYYLGINRGKRSIALDLREPDDLAAAQRAGPPGRRDDRELQAGRAGPVRAGLRLGARRQPRHRLHLDQRVRLRAPAGTCPATT